MASRKPVEGGLSEIERMFVTEYRKCRNATHAYGLVYVNSQTHIAKRTSAYRLINKPHIRDYINRLDKADADASEVTASKIIQGLARGAFWDAKNLFEDDGINYKKIKDMDIATRMAITGFHGSRPIMMDKNKCLELLGKIQALFTDRHQLDGSGMGNDIKINIDFRKVEDK